MRSTLSISRGAGGTAMVVFAVLTAGVAVVFALVVRENLLQRAAAAPSSGSAGFGPLVRDRRLLLLFSLSFFWLGVFNGLTTWPIQRRDESTAIRQLGEAYCAPSLTRRTTNMEEMTKQASFWDKWVLDSQAWEQDADNERRLHCVFDAVKKGARSGAKLLDVGCGSGWATLKLAALPGMGEVTGTDLAGDAMARMRETAPGVEWIAGDFMTLDFPKAPYDVVVCMETISHVPDQQAFARRIAELTARGGLVILTSQNPHIWGNASWVGPPGPGQLRNWPSRERLREFFQPFFELEPIRTCVPGPIADRGARRWLTNRYANRFGNALFGTERWAGWREALGCGCSLVVVGKRK